MQRMVSLQSKPNTRTQVGAPVARYRQAFHLASYVKLISDSTEMWAISSSTASEGVVLRRLTFSLR